jgi:hypothetical protein
MLGRIATADADLPSSSYGHLLADFAGPARRGNRDARLANTCEHRRVRQRVLARETRRSHASR